MEKLHFKGLLVPVFTPFGQDKKTINYDVIDKYGQYLKSKGIQGVLVNGITGEGTTLRVDERKRLAEEWLKVSRKYGLTMVLVIGGIGITDIYELGEHAEKIGVDGIVLLPDLFYKPRIEEDLVEYFKLITKYVTKTPLYYYHIPEYTSVKLYMPRFVDLVSKYVNNFSGIMYGDTDIIVAQELLRDGYHVIIAHETLLLGLKSLGFDTFSFISLNIYPDRFKEIIELLNTYKLREALDIHYKIIDNLREIFKNQMLDYVQILKLRLNKIVDFNLGGVRKPNLTLNKLY